MNAAPAECERRAVMTPVDDAIAFDRAAFYAALALDYRARKKTDARAFSPGYLEAKARAAERTVREIALQSEILLARRADGDQDHRVMLGVMLGSSL